MGRAAYGPCQVISDGLIWLDELIVHDDARRVVNQAYSSKLFSIFRLTLTFYEHEVET